MCNAQKGLTNPCDPFLGSSWHCKTRLGQKASMFDSSQTLWLLALRKTIWKQRLAYNSELHFTCLFLLYILQPLAYVFLSLPGPIPYKFFRELFFCWFSIYYLNTLHPFCLFHFVPVAATSIQDRVYHNQWQFGSRSQLFHSPLSLGIKNTHNEAGFLFFSLAHFKSLQFILNKRKILLTSKGQGKKKEQANPLGKKLRSYLWRITNALAIASFWSMFSWTGLLKTLPNVW